MRKLLFLLLVPSMSYGAVAHVKSGALGTTGQCSVVTTTVTCTYISSQLTPAWTPGSTSDTYYIGTGAAYSLAASAVTASATNWTFTTIDGPFGSNGNHAAAFCATTTSTAAVTFTVTWTVTSGGSGTFGTFEIDEFSGGSACNAIDNHKAVTTQTTTITPVANNCMIWAWNQDSNTSANNNSFTAGADDTNQDLTDYRLLSGGGGASQNVNGFGGGSGTVEMEAVTIAPPSVAGKPSGRAVIF
jgi:hypothetical protein